MKRLAIAALLAARVASAAPSEADEAFESGRALLEAKKYPEACAAFERSLALDFQFGTLFNVANCDEKIGKLASALKAYRKLARDDVNPTRKQTATDQVAKLAARVPRLVITVAVRAAGMHVQLDGDLVDDELGVEIPVDLGPHKVTATAPSAPEQGKSVEITGEGELARIELSFAPEAVAAPGATGSSRGTTGKVVVVSGGAVLVTGLVVGIVALRDWHDAKTRSVTDVAGANTEVRHVERLGDVSTVCVVAGAVAVAAGIYLWRSGSTTIAPQLGDSAGVVVSGRF